jgi:hypothetical protein
LDWYHQDIEQPYIDAKVAAVLCLGGPVAYVLKEGTGVGSSYVEWLLLVESAWQDLGLQQREPQ